MADRSDVTQQGLVQQIEAMHRKLVSLEQRVEGREAMSPVAAESMEELSTALEELVVAAEELRQKNDDLAAAREAIEAERTRYQALFDFAPDGYLVTNSEGIIREANQSAAKLLGVRQAFLTGKPLVVLAVAEEHSGLYTKLHDLRSGAVGKIDDWIVTLQPRDRSPFPAAVTVAAIRNVSGQMDGLLWLFRDATVRRQLEYETLKRRNLESLGTLAGGIAHDFNNLLSAILGNVSLAEMSISAGSNEESLDLLAGAEEVILQARELARQLLTFALGGTPVRTPVPLGRLLHEFAASGLGNSAIRLKFDIPDDLGPVEIDRAQVGQVIQNLVINAREAMPAGGTIWISAENVDIGVPSPLPLAPGRYVRISVKDQGVGISDALLPRVFDPYFTTKDTNSGLGLTICHVIISRHRGHITVESKPKQGATFSFYLPVSWSQVTPKPVLVGRPLSGGGRILAMDDEDMLRTVLSRMLTRLGYEVQLAEHGAEAIALYRQSRDSGHPFDAVILDLTVAGGMGGEETMRSLLEIDPAVKGIVSSGYSAAPVLEDFRKHGFCAVLSKPYDVETLDLVLNSVLAGAEGVQKPRE